MNKDDHKPLEDLELLYLGEAVTSKSTRGHLWLPLAAFDPDKTWQDMWKIASVFSAKGPRTFIIGGVYQARGILERGRLVTLDQSSQTYQRELHHVMFADLGMKAKVAKTKLRAAALEKKVKASPAAMAEVRALGDLLAGASYSDKSAMELTILHLIRRAAAGAL